MQTPAGKKFKDKTIIGLTGSFGAGKTTTAEMFEAMGAFRIDTDKLTHEAWRPESRVYEQIRGMFAKKFQWADNAQTNRKLVADIVFNEPEPKRMLEAVLHPYIWERTEELIAACGKEIVLLEVPLLFETHWDAFCDVTVAVFAPYEKIKTRLSRKNISEEELRRRTEAQWPLQEKVKKAKYVIDNSQTVEETRQQVLEILGRIRGESKGE